MKVYILYTVTIAGLCALREIMCDLHRWFDLQKLKWKPRKRQMLLIAGYLFYMLISGLITLSTAALVHSKTLYWEWVTLAGIAFGKSFAMMFQYD